MTYHLGIIGGGNMGGAIVRGGVRVGVLHASSIIVADIDQARLKQFESLGCAVTTDASAAASAEQIMLAVKPQAFPAVAQAVSPLSASKVVISIMAGLSSSKMRASLGPAARIVRAMPNTPCQVGAGMTAIALGEGAQPGDEAMAVALFDAIGRTVLVDESLMYAVTAVSGSGPAYVFLLAEAMEQAAIELGIDRHTARTLVEQTVMGAGRLLVESGQNASELRQAVTSPGGTTAAALEVMFEQELPEVIAEAVLAARNRGIELDQG